jgi:hypothetical protein
MNNFKNKCIFIIAILVIVLGIFIYSNKDDISQLIRINAKEVYENNSNINYSCIKKNKYILDAYEYNDSVSSGDAGYCVAGTENTCIKTDCAKYGGVGACPAGTIIKYQVNDDEIYYFNVLHDDGGVMTLQSVDAITSSAWGTSTTKGPVTALTAITDATKDWSNVNDLNYSLGETIFLKYPNDSSNANPYTGCSEYNSCTSNKYTLTSELTTNVKARIISVQEVSDIINSVNSSSNSGWIKGIYWTLSSSSNYPWYVKSDGSLYSSSLYKVNYSFPIKPVIEINK